MFSLSASHVLLVEWWILNYYVIYHVHNSYKCQWEAFTFSSLSHLTNTSQGAVVRKASTWMKYDERTISKSKHLIALLLVEWNTSEELKPLYPLHQLTLNDFGNVVPFFNDQIWDEASHGVLPLEIACTLESEPPQVKVVNDKRISLEMSSDKYIEICNRLMNIGRLFTPLEYPLKHLTTLKYSRRW